VERSFADLTTAELYEILELRQRVFILEQTCFYTDIDGLDPRALHLWTRAAVVAPALATSAASAASAASPVAAPTIAAPTTAVLPPITAYLRILPPGLAYAEPSLGRVIVDPTTRGTGLGLALMREGLRRAWHHFGPLPIRIGAQAYLERFYTSLGFQRASADYVADGIAHLEMLATPPAP
jgi:ElaA protein